MTTAKTTSQTTTQVIYAKSAEDGLWHIALATYPTAAETRCAPNLRRPCSSFSTDPAWRDPTARFCTVCEPRR